MHRLGQYPLRAVVAQVPQAVGQRIRAVAGRQFVHERLDCEHVGECAQGAQRGHPHRRRGHEVGGDGDLREVVERFRVALRTGGEAAAVARRGRGERGGAVPGGKQGGVPGRAARPGAVRVAAHLVPPAQDSTVGVQFGAAGNDHRGSKRLPAVLVRARPLDQHWPLRHRHGEQGGVQRDVVGAVVAVAAGPVDVDHPDARRRPLQRLGEGGAQLERPLGVRPDGQAPVAFQARSGGGGAERSVHQERTRVGGGDGRGVHVRRRRTAVQNRDGLGRRLAQGGTTVGGHARRRRTAVQNRDGLGRRLARGGTTVSERVRRRRTAVQNRDGLGGRLAQGGTTVGGHARRRRAGGAESG